MYVFMFWEINGGNAKNIKQKLITSSINAHLNGKINRINTKINKYRSN